MHFCITPIIDKWLSEYAECEKADPFPIWEYCNNEIICKIPENIPQEVVEQARFINNTLYWGRMGLNKYVLD